MGTIPSTRLHQIFCGAPRFRRFNLCSIPLSGREIFHIHKEQQGEERNFKDSGMFDESYIETDSVDGFRFRAHNSGVSSELIRVTLGSYSNRPRHERVFSNRISKARSKTRTRYHNQRRGVSLTRIHFN
ncbi:unnamed protein product [Nezara viridula]|uniref:Uncharacterized protein n=1 Tax=Nezara viridula TaxID=85310 RepID=A0A9P0EBP4_NEZVI|nr:unnamed protein product [Nezara viridula]